MAKHYVITIEVITLYIEVGMEGLRWWHLNTELDEVTEQAFSGEGHSKQRAADAQALRWEFTWLVHDKQGGWDDREKRKERMEDLLWKKDLRFYSMCDEGVGGGNRTFT